MIFKIYNCEFGLTVDGTNYVFDHVFSVAIENPERRRLRRGANASNTTGIDYREGLTEAKTWTIVIANVTKALHDLMKQCYAAGTRVDCYAIDKGDGSGKTAKNGVICQDPMQMGIDDSAESMNLTLTIESFDVSEVHKT